MKIEIEGNVYLESINDSHSAAIFDVVENNRTFLREWLSFVDKMQTVEFAENFVKGVIQKKKDGLEYAFLILENGHIIGPYWNSQN